MNYEIRGRGLVLALALASCIRETPADEAIPGDEETGDLPGDDAPANDEPAVNDLMKPAGDLPAQEDDAGALEENRDASIATALAMYQTGQGKDAVCDWLAGQCPRSIGTRERAAKALAGHNAGF